MSKNEIIHDYYPHYTNEHYRHARVIWGKNEQGLKWDYSDRLYEWNPTKYDKAVEIANKKAKSRTAQWVEIFLSEYYHLSCKIICIQAGFNWSNGFPYQIFGYKIFK